VKQKTLFPLFLLATMAFSTAASTMSFSEDVKRTCGQQVDFLGEIENTKDAAQFFRLSALDPSGWFTYYTTPSAQVSPGEKTKFVFLATPSPATPPGEYNLFITAEGSSGERMTKTIWVIVRDCTELVLAISGAQAACAGNSLPLSITVRNDGEEEAFGTISLDVESDFAGPNSFALASGESKKFTAFATIPLNQSPGTIQITASASTGRGKTSASTALEVRDCAQTIQTQPARQQAGAAALSGFFTGAAGITAVGIIILVVVIAFLFTRLGPRHETGGEEHPPRPVLAPIPAAPQKPRQEAENFQLPELPEVVKAWRVTGLGEAARKRFLKRAKKLEKKIRKATGLAG